MTAWLKFEKLNSYASIPSYSHEFDSGFDLSSCINTVVGLNEVITVPTGLRVEIEPGYEIQIRPRSGLAAKHGLVVVNSPGTIDNQYRGELKIILSKIKDDGTKFEIKIGDRIAQGVLIPVMRASILEGSVSTDTSRSSGGFGSTGIRPLCNNCSGLGYVEINGIKAVCSKCNGTKHID